MPARLLGMLCSLSWADCCLSVAASVRSPESAASLLQVRTLRTIEAGVAPGSLKDHFPFYHTTDELTGRIAELAQSCQGAQLSVRTETQGEVSLDVVSLRRSAAGGEDDHQPVNRFFVLCGEHARELISPASCLVLLEMLCGEKPVAAEAVSISEVLAHTEFQLVVNANPRSRRKVEAGDFCLRANPAGVDLNRNWDEHFVGAAQSGYGTNPGPRPFSEPETQLLKRVVTAFNPTSFLCVHSGTKGLYMPWAYSTSATSMSSINGTAGTTATRMLKVLQKVDADHCECPFGAAGKEVGYPCPGTSLDWVFEKLNTPYAFAYEIYTGPAQDESLRARWLSKLKSGGAALLKRGHNLAHAHFKERPSEFVQLRSRRSSAGHRHGRAPRHQSAYSCFNDFNPSTEASYDAVVRNWATAYLQTAHLVAQDLRAAKSHRGPV